MLAAAPFRPSEEKEHVCPPSIRGHYLPATLHSSNGSQEVLGQPPLTLGRHQGPLDSVKTSTHCTSRPSCIFTCKRLKGREAFHPRGELSPQTTPGTPVPQVPKGTPSCGIPTCLAFSASALSALPDTV